MAGRVHERDRTAAGHRGHGVANEVAVDDQDARGLRAAGELMR